MANTSFSNFISQLNMNYALRQFPEISKKRPTGGWPFILLFALLANFPANKTSNNDIFTYHRNRCVEIILNA